MPRFPPRALPSSASIPVTSPGPRLWNAHRRIETTKGLSEREIQRLKKDPYSTRWRSIVSQDVVDFVDTLEGRDATQQPINEMLPEEKLKLLRFPVRYFSRPHNVPESARKQVYFPEAQVTLLRTPHLGPYFAQFDVPLSFGKLDIKSYLKNLYNVDVSHVRSYVVYQKKARRTPARKYARGTLYQTPFKKKMTVQLVEPFVYPKAPAEAELASTTYEKERYWTSIKKQFAAARTEQAEYVDKADKVHRRSIAEQAQDLLRGKTQWKPTWKSFPTDSKVMEGRHRSVFEEVEEPTQQQKKLEAPSTS